MKIIVNNLQRRKRLGKRFEVEVKTAVKKLLKGWRQKGELSITLVDDKQMRLINRKFRPGFRLPAVLSFPMGDKYLLGDVIISLEAVVKYAKIGGCSFKD